MALNLFKIDPCVWSLPRSHTQTKNCFLVFYGVQFCTNTLIKVTATCSTRIDNAIGNIVIKGKRCEVNNSGFIFQMVLKTSLKTLTT